MYTVLFIIIKVIVELSKNKNKINYNVFIFVYFSCKIQTIVKTN